MTCIVAYKTNKGLIFGSDTEISDDSSKNKDDVRKIFLVDDFIFGVAGDIVVNNELQWNFEFKKPTVSCSDEKYICKYLRNQLKTFLKDKDNCFDEKDEFVGQLLIGYKNELYVISSDFAITKVKGNFTAIGSGSDYAMGSLYTTKDMNKLSVENKIKMSIMAAGEFASGCNKEVYIYG